MEIIRKEYSIPSKSGIADVFARCWLPSDSVKAVFQIVHGMAEHGERYEDFANFLCQKGFAVVVDDHIGHGKSVKSDNKLGYFGDDMGWDALVEDEKAITEFIKNEIPDAPIVFFGHSMGSFIAREYIRRYGTDSRIKATIFCGSSGKNPAAAIAIRIAGAIAKVKGTMHRSEFINKIAFGTYNSKIPNAKTPFDWLTTDAEIVDKYIEDKYCGFLFTAAGYKDLFTILHTVSGKDWYNGVCNDIPILLTAGEEDPVGTYGKGIKEIYNNLINTGKKDVTIRLYPGMRHEILNETERATVYEDIAAWSLSKIK